jgi:hypothetical protein
MTTKTEKYIDIDKYKRQISNLKKNYPHEAKNDEINNGIRHVELFIDFLEKNPEMYNVIRDIKKNNLLSPEEEKFGIWGIIKYLLNNGKILYGVNPDAINDPDEKKKVSRLRKILNSIRGFFNLNNKSPSKKPINTEQYMQPSRSQQSRSQQSRSQQSRSQQSRLQQSRSQQSRSQQSRSQQSRMQPSRMQPSRMQPSRMQPSRMQPSRIWQPQQQWLPQMQPHPQQQQWLPQMQPHPQQQWFPQMPQQQQPHHQQQSWQTQQQLFGKAGESLTKMPWLQPLSNDLPSFSKKKTGGKYKN